MTILPLMSMTINFQNLSNSFGHVILMTYIHDIIGTYNLFRRDFALTNICKKKKKIKIKHFQKEVTDIPSSLKQENRNSIVVACKNKDPRIIK